MTERETALKTIEVGDIFHASAPNGASLICITLQVTKSAIYGKRITTQSHHAFDISTGVEQGDDTLSTIDSIAPLPADICDALIGLDRVYAQGWKEQHHKLTVEEKRALLFVGKFYRDNPLP